MTIQSLDTAFKSGGSRMQDGAYYVKEISTLAATQKSYIAAPFRGKLVRAAFCNGETTMSGSNNYAIGMVNASDSDTALITATTVNDLGSATYTGAFLAAYGNVDLLLSTTAANLTFEEGDILELTNTVEGTVVSSNILLYFEPVLSL